MPWVRAYYNPAEAGVMTSPLDGTQLFESAREVMTTIREMVAAVKGLSNFKAAIGGWLTWVTVIFTLVLLSVAVSQVGLLVSGWRLFCGQLL